MKYTQIVAAALMIIPAQLYGCTGMFLKNGSGGHVHARTLEFGQPLNSEILFVPRNHDYQAPSPATTTGGLTWKTKYATLGANAFGKDFFVDAVNEKGLAGGLFYFPGFEGYQKVAPKDYDKSLPMWSLLTWILTSCATTQEVKAALPKLYITDAPLIGTDKTPPAHLIINDNAGNSIVIEYTRDGVRHVYDNPLGTITNSPGFDWHLINLRNYITLSPVNAPPVTMSGMKFAQLGEGSGMQGLPGDTTPPARFVRVTAYTQAALPTANETDGILQAFHILNNFDIPKGSVIAKDGTPEITEWTSAIDMKNIVYHIKTHTNFQIQRVALSKFDLNAKKTSTIPLSNKNVMQDLI